MKKHFNDADGFQIEWNGILLTVRPNQHHGISGSIAVHKDGVTKVLSFHGKTDGTPAPVSPLVPFFPLTFHEETL